ncbi:hypothetical protein RAS1_20850 [Phycisphaerae bacterium RAS1]|nr:hypothetical protein RAS1_20850 [Phycisphaerae bacterium RAS1]
MSGAILALGVINAGLLAGLGLALVPVIIHFLSRRRYRRMPWAATVFLLEAEKENRRRVRFEQWLLLALRCLAMALLALLVARPFARAGIVGSLLGSGAAAQRIIVLDDSASSGYRATTRSDLERICEAATRLLAWLREESPQDAVSVWLTSRDAEPLVSRTPLESISVESVRAKLGELRPAALRARPARVLKSIFARTALGSVAEMYLLSDFQRSDWLEGPDAASVALDSLRGAAGKDAPSIVLAPVGEAVRPNLAILEIAPTRPQTIAGLPALIEAVVANLTTRPLKDAALAVALDRAAVPAAPIEPIEPGGRGRVLLEVTFPDEGFHELSVSLTANDTLSVDDLRRASFWVRPAISVLLINGQPAADPATDEVALLRYALAPPGPFSSGVNVEVITADELETSDLGRFEAVLACNIAAPTEGAAAALVRYVQAGGGVVFFLGENTGDPDGFNRALFDEGRGVLPAPLVSRAAVGGDGVGLVRVGAHPITAMFPAGAESISEYVHFREFYRCAEPGGADAGKAGADGREAPRDSTGAAAAPASAPASSAASVVARYLDAENSAAWVERVIGRGRAMLFTSTIDQDWNDWARAPDGSYVVTLLELVQHVARRSPHAMSYDAGEALELAVSPEAYDPTAVFKSPAFPEVPSTPARVRESELLPGQLMTLVGPPADAIGAWQIELRTRDGREEVRPLCVNLDPRESDLTPASSAELEALFRGLPLRIASVDQFLTGRERGRYEIWPTVLLVLVGVLLMEQTLAWWFGRAPAGGLPAGPSRFARRGRR